MGEEKGPEFYTGEGYLQKGALKHNMQIYKQAYKCLPNINKYKTIIELGCGVGYFASLIKEHVYYGIDFSYSVIQKAKKINPDKNKIFIIADLLNKSIYQSLYKDDCMYVCLETLEHIKKDIEVIKTIPSGSPIIFSVPNRDFTSHVRFFKSKNEIIERYQEVIDFNKCEWKIIETNPKKNAKIFMFKSRRL